MKFIQLKWSDESEWKFCEELSKTETVETQLQRLRKAWAAEKAKHKIEYDCEFRALEVQSA